MDLVGKILKCQSFTGREKENKALSWMKMRKCEGKFMMDEGEKSDRMMLEDGAKTYYTWRLFARFSPWYLS
jgi:hypothetical protein